MDEGAVGTRKQGSQSREVAKGVAETCNTADLKGDLARLEL